MNGCIGICTREAKPSDARAVAAILRVAFEDLRDRYTPEAFAKTVQPESGVLLRLREGPVWVAERGAIVVGTVSAVRTSRDVMLRGMAVRPEARGLGVGKALLSMTERFAWDQGSRTIFLYTTAFLHDAIRLYQASGFQFTGDKTQPHGTELLEMMKVLTGPELKKANP